MKKLFKGTALLRPVYVCLVLLFILLIPSFYRMLQPGLYSMQDFPYFRLVEYSKCVRDAQIPCRFAPDAGLGFGEPVFNFYSHIPFFLGSVAMSLGLGGIDSLKLLFALSLVGSAFAMFLLAKEVWKNNLSAFVSALVYVYAPYRAVNVWVRGALPESFAFVFLPLILFCFEKYLKSKKIDWLLGYILSLSLLVITHNLSILLFAPTIGTYILLKLLQAKSLKSFIVLTLASLVSLLLVAFYLLPAGLESQLVNLQTTTQGYFDFRAHFVTIPQLFVSRFWGYGGSTWGDQDGLSLSIGQVQWIGGLLILAFGVQRYIQKKRKDSSALFAMYLIVMSLFSLFLTHNKSAFLWEYFSSFMKYIQFPWRFLGISLFCLSLAAGYLVTLFPKYRKWCALVIVTLVIVLNYNYFHEDLWHTTNDVQMQTGNNWIEQSRASIGDYWPTYGPIPVDFTTADFPNLQPTLKKSSMQLFDITTEKASNVEFPLTYFPDWVAEDSGQTLNVNVSSKGLVLLSLTEGIHHVTFTFKNTMIRTIGNSVSLGSLVFLTIVFILIKKKKISLW